MLTDTLNSEGGSPTPLSYTSGQEKVTRIRKLDYESGSVIGWPAPGNIMLIGHVILVMLQGFWNSKFIFNLVLWTKNKT